MSDPYRGLILAAGRGSRMKQLTDEQPKCLTMIEGKTLLDWQCGALRKAGIDDIVVITGYREEALVGDFTKLQNVRWAETNMVVSLLCAPLVDKDTVVSYSDIVYHSNHVAALMADNHDITITADVDWLKLWALRFSDPLSDAETLKMTEYHQLIEIGQKTNRLEDIQAQYMGLLKITPKGWEQIIESVSVLPQEAQDALDMTALLNRLLKENIPIHVLPIQGKWCEVDSESDLRAYENAISEGTFSHDWR